MDYSTYWGMSASPFSDGPNPTTSPQLDEALARLSFLVDEKRPLGILVGAAGTGKSTLLQHFRVRLTRRGIQVASESLLGRQSYEMLWHVGNQLGAQPQAGEPLLAIWNALEARLTELAIDRRQVAILLDDVDLSLGDAVTQISRLVALAERFPSFLTLVLGSSPENVSRLGTRLLQQAHLRIELDFWTFEDTLEFMRRAMVRTGRAISPFERAAVERLHFLAQGMPGLIRRTAELALMVAANERRESIDEGLIEAIHSEFAQTAAA